MSKKQSGFTLIELMITVAVIAILAAIALPSYQDYVTRTKLTGAYNALSGLSVSLQQYYQDNRTYVGACANGTSAPIPTDPYFTITCPTLSATAFSIVATGNAGGPVAGFVFDADQDGLHRTTAAPSGWTSSGTCWIRSRSGSCT